ncbi:MULTISPECIES: protein phosphatase 2C domain-containing protein [unclassified Cryobacterium]|uniref:protein phosphatase 2C domain-containing protein n=1 Tax=unclassified Cryobacterium TaxID=2649013 RepID=UPI00106AAD37|nr:MULTISPECIES: protein phosphatase 2C domain-containing protein [unclassified Cryobacterium]TFB96274.1 hypothetical protein E3O39_09210 [Cryobacterium sp. MDB2-A-1]TFC12559.1 hypothetical protein E3O35_06375 [Cryobacterium sp. MDB2-A-2]
MKHLIRLLWPFGLFGRQRSRRHLGADAAPTIANTRPGQPMSHSVDSYPLDEPVPVMGAASQSGTSSLTVSPFDVANVGADPGADRTGAVEGATPEDVSVTSAEAAEAAEPQEAEPAAVVPPLVAPRVPVGNVPAIEPIASGAFPPGRWVKPGPFVAVPVADGPNAGSAVIGTAGSLLEVMARLAMPTPGGHRPAIVVDRIDSGALAIGAVSLRGAAHYDGGRVRQDSYSVGESRDGAWFIATIADGVSQGALSQIGADAAAQTGVSQVQAELARSGFDDADWQSVAVKVRDAVRARAEAVLAGSISNPRGEPMDVAGVSDRQYAVQLGTTAEFIVVANRADIDGAHRYVRVVVAGDGSSLILDPSKGWQVLSLGKSTSSGTKSNAVTALPLDPGPATVQHGTLHRGQALLVTTDGIGDFLLDGSTEVGGYLHNALKSPVGPVDLVRAASFVTFQADDDRTVVIVWA